MASCPVQGKDTTTKTIRVEKEPFEFKLEGT